MKARHIKRCLKLLGLNYAGVVQKVSNRQHEMHKPACRHAHLHLHNDSTWLSACALIFGAIAWPSLSSPASACSGSGASTRSHQSEPCQCHRLIGPCVVVTADRSQLVLPISEARHQCGRVSFQPHFVPACARGPSELCRRFGIQQFR